MSFFSPGISQSKSPTVENNTASRRRSLPPTTPPPNHRPPARSPPPIAALFSHNNVSFSPEGDDDTSLPPDPLLKPGAFIEPEPDDDDAPVAAEPLSFDRPSTPVHYSEPGENAGEDGDAAVDVPDWLPIGWRMESRVRVSGVSAGHRDKSKR
ncbi:hypothetical protein AKJ16_DCAP19865 [Drosera capensis]